ncbi:MAG TPA: hypothetical protein V6C81_29400 [Planktothrix sp.]|jgi:hypothetical protein
MSTIIFVSFIAAVILVGLFLHGRERRKMKAERELKLKLAEGGIAPPPAKKRKKKRRWLKKNTQKTPLSDSSTAEYLEKVPPFLEKVLAAFHARTDAEAARVQAVVHRQECHSEQSGAAAVPARPERVRSFNIWLKTAVNSIKDSFNADRQLALREDELDERGHDLKEMKRSLEDWLRGLAVYDQSEMHPELERLVSIAEALCKECTERDFQGTDCDRSPEPQEVDPELQTHVDGIVDSMQRLFAALAEMSIARNESSTVYTAFAEAAKPRDLVEPQKPSDQEVQPFINSTFEWVQEVQTGAAAWHTTVPSLDETIAASTSAVADLRRQMEALKNAVTQKREKRKQESMQRWSWPTQPSQPAPAADARPTDTASTAEAEKSAAKPEGPQLRPWWEIPAKAATAVSKQPTAFLTDEQEATEELAKRFASRAESMISEVRAFTVTRNSETGRNCEGAPSQEEAGTIKALRAAMRTLGFAIAQRNVAKAKLDAFKEEPVRAVESSLPSLEEANVELFIRGHKRHTDESARAEKAGTERRERYAALQEQFNERHRQVVEAANALATLLHTLNTAIRNRETLPTEVDAVRRASELLTDLYVPPPAQPAEKARRR